MKILFVSDAQTFGGHEMMALKAASALSMRQHTVTLGLPLEAERFRAAIDQANRHGAQIRVVDHGIGALRLNPLQAPWRWSRLAGAMRLYRSEAPDCAVVIQGRIESGSSFVIAGMASGLATASYLPMAHDLRSMGVAWLPGMRDFVNGAYYRAMPSYIVISQQVAQDLLRRAPRVQVQVVENIVDPPTPLPIDRSRARAAIGLSSSAPVVAQIGRIAFDQKGHDRIAQALADEPRLQRVQWLVVGDGPDSQALDDIVRSLGLHDRVRRLPWRHGELDSIYAAADMVALPSRYEGVPLVMLEALARSVPVIGSDLDGMSDWLPPQARFDRTSSARIADAVLFAAQTPAAPFDPAFVRARARTSTTRYAEEWELALNAVRRPRSSRPDIGDSLDKTHVGRQRGPR